MTHGHGLDEGYLQAQILHLFAAAESSRQDEGAHNFHMGLSRRSASSGMRLSRYHRYSSVTGVCVIKYSDHLEASLNWVPCNAISHKTQSNHVNLNHFLFLR